MKKKMSPITLIMLIEKSDGMQPSKAKKKKIT